MVRIICFVLLTSAAQPARAEDWPLFGGTPARNMANPTAKNVPIDWGVARKNVKWEADLGDKSYGGPVIAGGRVFVGTSHRNGNNPNKIFKSVVMCFREGDGKLLWQRVHDAPPGPLFKDVEEMGLLSTPAVAGKNLYYVLPECVVVCLDAVTGLVVWQYDMRKELKVSPFHCGNCSPLVVGDLVYVVTGNGRDDVAKKVLRPDAPSFIALHRDTGKLVWKSNLPGPRIIEGQWSNPAYAVIQGKAQVVFPGGDATTYSFEPLTGKLIWQCHCHPKGAKLGNVAPYIISTPVIHDDRVYVGLGVYPSGHAFVPRSTYFLCIDATRKGDVSPGMSYDPRAGDNKNSAIVWAHGGMVEPARKKGRPANFGTTISTCAIHDGLLYIAEESGYMHCLDARSGVKYWMHDLKTSTWSSPYYADGKVFLGTEDGEIVIFQAGTRDMAKILAKMEVDGPYHGTPVVANGVLYVMTASKLYAIAAK